MSRRLEAMAKAKIAKGHDPGRTRHYIGTAPGGKFARGVVRLVPEALDDPLGWRKPRRVFVNSMSDTFHPEVPSAHLDAMWDTMRRAGRHTFQVLTKRPERQREWMQARADESGVVPPNIWAGVSVENRKHGLPRIEHLRQTPAAVRFLSCEPLLENLGELDLSGIHWVIVGGESGRKARPMHPDWVRSIRDQCLEQGVAFFFKQFGEYGPTAVRMTDGTTVFREFGDFHTWLNKAPTWLRSGDVCVDTKGRICRNGGDMMRAREGAFPVAVVRRVGKRAAGRLLDGREWNELPDAERLKP